MENESNRTSCGSRREIVRIDLDDIESDSTDTYSQQEFVKDTVDIQSDKYSKTLKGILYTESMKFMNNFDPESSNREKRKLNRKFNLDYAGKKISLYDETGILRVNGKDLCDCLNEECVGCHFPCPKCRSYKCGNECRINRKWMCEAIENEGDKAVTKNKLTER